MKTTKSQAREIYDSFFGILRCLNGGTAEENKRSAPRCYERLKVHASEATEASANPSKLFRADNWLWSAVNELPARAAAFADQYGLNQPAESTSDGWDCEVDIFSGSGRHHKRWFTVYPSPCNELNARALAFKEGGFGCDVVSVKKHSNTP